MAEPTLAEIKDRIRASERSLCDRRRWITCHRDDIAWLVEQAELAERYRDVIAALVESDG